MKYADIIKETDKGFIVIINDNGYVPMRELKDGEWQICYFPTYEEAERARDDYNRVWIG